MFSLARIILPDPVTLTLPATRLRVMPGYGPVPAQGDPRTFAVFNACFTVNPSTRTIHAQLPPLPRALLIYGASDFSAACADTPEQHAERVLEILGTDPQSYLQAVIDGIELPVSPARVPREIELWQAKAVMFAMGLISQVEASIAAMPEPQRTVAQCAWSGNARLARRGPTVTALAPALGLTDAQLDSMFIQASELSV